MTRDGVIERAADVIDIGIRVLTILGIARVAKGSDEPQPVIGNIKLL